MAKAQVGRTAGVNKTLIEPVQEMLKRGQYQQAASRLAALRRQLPANAQIMALQGDAFRGLERHQDAVDAYRLAQNAGLQSRQLTRNLAFSYVKLKQPEVVLDLAKQLAADGDKATALGLKAEAYRLLNQLATARSYFRKAVALQPENARLYMAMAHLDTFTAESAIFEVLKRHAETADLKPADQATAWATLAKAYLDIGDHDQAFANYARANQIMDESLPPIRSELERLLSFTRSHFTPSLFDQLSPYGHSACQQIVIAGMSRSGKSLVESLFQGVDGVELAGEALLLSEFQTQLLEPYQQRIDNWLVAQTPDDISEAAKRYAEKLAYNDKIKITTIPGDLWHLGWFGLLAPNVPIIFCVRDVLDLGVTGFFRQYETPSGYRYSYNLHHMGRQIACSEKVMEHWSQVLPNPVYLVDYEALVQDPQTVRANLLSQLGLTPSGALVLPTENASVVDTLSPVVSFDGAVPFTDRFIGFGQNFIKQLQPLIDGYETIVKQFPRHDPPATFPHPLPETFAEEEQTQPLPSQEVAFDWKLVGKTVVIDNGAQLISGKRLQSFLSSDAFEVVVFDPLGDAAVDEASKQHEHLHYVPQALLGDGKPTHLYASLSPSYNSTLKPLHASQQPKRLREAAMTVAELTVQTHALDEIDGLERVDWLLLDACHDSLSVLKNGKQRLASCLVVQARINFEPLWQKQTTFDALCAWAANNGFRFHRFVDFNYAETVTERSDLTRQPEGTTLAQAAALFVPSDARLEGLDDSHRLRLAFLLDTVYGIHDLCFEVLKPVSEQLAENYLKAKGFFDPPLINPDLAEWQKLKTALNASEGRDGVEQITQWRHDYPQSPRVAELVALQASWRGQHANAFNQLDKAIRQAPDDLSLRFCAVNVLLRAGMWWEADKLLEQLKPKVQTHPEFTRLKKWLKQVRPSQLDR